ncbi:MAG: serine hydrolase [Caldilineaceae bacterium]|nr:serine hydrolase [Caldilineaceae bacterium]
MITTLLWQRLEERLQALITDFPGIAGIALTDLTSNQTMAINADEIFPTASTIKIHVLTQLLVRAEAGEIDLQQRVAVSPANHVLGSGVLAYLGGPVELTLLDLAILMIIASDNTATNLCIAAAGLDATNGLLQQLGLHQTRLQRKMMDHIAAVREQENVATPRELVTMLALLHQGKPSPWVAEQTLAILQKPKRGFIDRALPPTVAIANKPGWVDGVMCDAALVYLPRRPYLVALMTKHALCTVRQQEQFLFTLAATIHEHMVSLDTTNRYGRTVYPTG